MKTNFLKSICKTIAALTVLCFMVCPLSGLAATREPDVVAPQNIAIISTYSDFELGTSGKLLCYGETLVQDGYTAGVTMELQQYSNSKWTTIKTWSSTAVDFAYLDETHYAASGYSYRLKLTYKAYSSSLTLVESIVSYSNTIIYTQNSK